jgi:hypothetical protein
VCERSKCEMCKEKRDALSTDLFVQPLEQRRAQCLVCSAGSLTSSLSLQRRTAHIQTRGRQIAETRASRYCPGPAAAGYRLHDT